VTPGDTAPIRAAGPEARPLNVALEVGPTANLERNVCFALCLSTSTRALSVVSIVWLEKAPRGKAINDAVTGPVTAVRSPRLISMRGSSIGFVVLVLLAVAVAAFLLAPGSGRVDTSAGSRSPVHWK